MSLAMGEKANEMERNNNDINLFSNSSKNPKDVDPLKDIFVGNLSLYTDEAKLRKYFSKFGKVEDVRIMYHPDTNKSRRFGFVTFADSTSLKLVLGVEVHGTLDGKIIECKPAQKRKKSSDTTSPDPPNIQVEDGGNSQKVFVGGIGQDVNQHELAHYFGKFGNLDSVVLVPDRDTGRHRGFGFVTYFSEEVAKIVCAKKFHEIKGRHVEVKMAKLKPEASTQQRAPTVFPPAYQQQQEQQGSSRLSLLGDHPFQLLINSVLSNAYLSFQSSLLQQQQQQQHQLRYLPYSPHQSQHQQQRFVPYGPAQQVLPHYLTPLAPAPTLTSPAVLYSASSSTTPTTTAASATPSTQNYLPFQQQTSNTSNNPFACLGNFGFHFEPQN